MSFGALGGAVEGQTLGARIKRVVDDLRERDNQRIIFGPPPQVRRDDHCAGSGGLDPVALFHAKKVETRKKTRPFL